MSRLPRFVWMQLIPFAWSWVMKVWSAMVVAASSFAGLPIIEVKWKDSAATAVGKRAATVAFAL